MKNLGYIYVVYNDVRVYNSFYRGISVAGQNGDLVAHATGRSCDAAVQDAGSRYIRGTTSLVGALNDATRQSILHPRQYFYVVTVRSTPHWYNLARSLELLQHELAPDSRFGLLVSFTRSRSAWITPEPILPQDILRARVIENGHITVDWPNPNADLSQAAYVNYAPYRSDAEQTDANAFDQVVLARSDLSGVLCAFTCGVRRPGLMLLQRRISQQQGLCTASMGVVLPIGQAYGRALMPALLTIL